MFVLRASPTKTAERGKRSRWRCNNTKYGSSSVPGRNQHSQFRLPLRAALSPFFGAQAFGAFNDNVYKNVLVILATYHAASYTQIDTELLINMANGC
jgi:hypothetical protein